MEAVCLNQMSRFRENSLHCYRFYMFSAKSSFSKTIHKSLINSNYSALPSDFLIRYRQCQIFRKADWHLWELLEPRLHHPFAASAAPTKSKQLSHVPIDFPTGSGFLTFRFRWCLRLTYTIQTQLLNSHGKVLNLSQQCW